MGVNYCLLIRKSHGSSAMLFTNTSMDYKSQVFCNLIFNWLIFDAGACRVTVLALIFVIACLINRLDDLRANLSF